MIVVDTHVLVWRAIHPEKLTSKARQAVEKAEAAGVLRVCEITLVEIAMLMKRGRLETGLPYREFMHAVLLANDYLLTGINPEIAALSVEFPEEINKDPADRILAATALYYKAQLVTADGNLRKSGIVPTLW